MSEHTKPCTEISKHMGLKAGAAPAEGSRDLSEGKPIRTWGFQKTRGLLRGFLYDGSYYLGFHIRVPDFLKPSYWFIRIFGVQRSTVGSWMSFELEVLR